MNRREIIQLMVGAGLAREFPLLGESPTLPHSTLKVNELRCEYLTNPLGIDTEMPRLSWILTAISPDRRNLRQSAYRILVAATPELLQKDEGDLWDSGKVNSDDSILIEYNGKPLLSRARAWWKVRVWDQDGNQSAWSDPASWTMGLLAPDDWHAKWIGLEGGEDEAEETQDALWITSASGQSNGNCFRSIVRLPEHNPLSYAVLMIMGTHPLHVTINNTNYRFDRHSPRLFVSDVTSALHAGSNQLIVSVEPDQSGTEATIMGGLTLDLADGTILHFHTDTEWQSTELLRGATAAAVPAGNWSPVRVAEPPPAVPPVKPIRPRLPARMLRKEFLLRSQARRATIYISGVGDFELYLNGQKISDDIFGLNVSNYDKRVYYRTCDVSGIVKQGANAVGVLLGNGRFFAPRNYNPTTRSYGYPKLLMQMEVEHLDGTIETMVSDASWKVSADGPIRANNEYDGEEYDARRELSGWDQAGYVDDSWKAAELVGTPLGRLRAQMNPPIRVVREMRPVNLNQPRPGVYVFDMGQNMVGWCRLKVTGHRDARVRIRHAERLRPDGMLYTDNLRSARATDIYVLSGSGEEQYHPRFTYHGFQYVELTGYPGTPDLSTITGQVIHDDLREHADFSTSNGMLNQIYKNVLWGTRGNYRSMPTDCPQRDERQGWLGDRAGGSKGETFLFEVSPLYAKWLMDIEDGINGQGSLDDVAPNYWNFYQDNVTWPATFIIAAAGMYEQYGDRRVIQSHYPAMKQWIDHMNGHLQGDLMPCDTYGDWCVPPESLTQIHSTDPSRQTAAEVLGTSYYYFLLRLMSRFAVIAGNASDQSAFDDLAARMKVAFHNKYFNPADNTYSNGSQTSSILPLAFDMTLEDKRQGVVQALVENIRTKTNGHIGTGLVGAQWIMETLTRFGHANLAYEIATQRTYPSWGYMVSKGATTIWELWNGDTADPEMNSMNHLMLVGDLISWCYQSLAGIKADVDRPGFKHIVVAPILAGDLTVVKASHASPYGTIATSWERSAGRFSLHLTIPINTTATVYVPAKTPDAVLESGRTAQKSPGVKFLRSETGVAVLQLGSGDFFFTSVV